MDKLYFYVRRMDKTLEKSKAILDEIESKTQGQYWCTVNDLTIDDNIPDDDTDNDSFYEESDSNTDSTSSSEEETRSTKTLGDKVIDIWNKRRYKLVTDFAIAGWLLSPIPDIYEDSKIHMNGHHRKTVKRLLKKLMGSHLPGDSDELSEIMNNFWEEFEQFKSKAGPFE